jgi:hypothetical protein
VLAGAGLFLAACSNGPALHHPTTTTTTTTAHSPMSTTSTTAAASTTSSTGAAAPPCNHISAAVGQGQGAAGTITGVITVTNTGTTACGVDGYPTVALYSGSGAPLTVTMVNGLTVSISPQANASPSPATIAPSGTAQFAYQFEDVPVGNQTSCPTSEQGTTTMPGASTSSGYFAFAISPCNNGTIKVSPVYKTS